MRLSIANCMACGDAWSAKRKNRRAAPPAPRQTADDRCGASPPSSPRLISPLAAELDAAPSKADAPLTEASLPLAAFAYVGRAPHAAPSECSPPIGQTPHGRKTTTPADSPGDTRYLIVVQWNQDYGQATQAPEAPAITDDSPASSRETGEADSGNLSVPSGGTGNAEMGSEMPGSEAAASSRDLVAVTTDVLDVRIDPQGGDIVYAALPQHKYAENSDQPFVLLSDNSTRSYVARSGLQLEGHQGASPSPPSRPNTGWPKGTIRYRWISAPPSMAWMSSSASPSIATVTP